MYVWTSLCCVAAHAVVGAASSAQAAEGFITIGNEQLGITLDESQNYALASICVNGTAFESGGKFPCFKLFDAQGKEEQFFPEDERWQVKAEHTENGISVIYSYAGFNAVVKYNVGKDNDQHNRNSHQ